MRSLSLLFLWVILGCGQRPAPETGLEVVTEPQAPDPTASSSAGEVASSHPAADLPSISGRSPAMHPEWPDELPPLPGFLFRGEPTQFENGSRQFRLVIVDDDDVAKARFAQWVQALAESGIQLENDRDQESTRSATLVGTRRYFVHVSNVSPGTVVVQEAQTRPPTLGTQCQTVPEDEWNIMVSDSYDSTRRWNYGFSTQWSHDFDLDGNADALVPVVSTRRPERACPETVSWDVYLSRGGCGHLAGRIEGSVDDLVPAQVRRGAQNIETTITPLSLHESRDRVTYSFDGSRYRELSRDSPRPRCEVHPADCRQPRHRYCELRNHPTLLSLVDGEELSALLGEAAARAQATCATIAARTERCEVQPSFAADGTLSSLEVSGCPERQACVSPLFRFISISPFMGDPPLQSISFQIPAP